MPIKPLQHIRDLQPDEANANKGTPRGRAMLEESLRKYGAARSIVVDKHGKVIGGNKTLETAADIGLDDIEVVKTDGHKLVVVQRTDLDLDTDKKARELAYADNRTGEIDLDWDPSQLLADQEAGVDLSQFFSDKEFDAIIGADHENKAVTPLKVAKPTEIVWVLMAIPIEKWAKHLPVIESMQVDAQFSSTIVRPKDEQDEEKKEQKSA